MLRHIPFHFVGLLVAVVMLSACTEAKLAVHGIKVMTRHEGGGSGTETQPDQQGYYKVGDPYQVEGVWYYPAVDPQYDETGVASWYGPDFHGKATANGARYNMNAMTAAHKTLPMPTKVRVTNLDNGRSVILTVNDRGPFVKDRIIDVSRAAAEALGFLNQGTARVRVAALRPADLSVEQKSANVLPGPTGTKEMQGDEPEPAQPEMTAAADDGLTPGPANEPTQAETATDKQIFVQVAAFGQQANADQFVAMLSAYGDAVIKPVSRDTQTLYRVQLGPMETVDQADATLARLASGGYSEARMVIE